MSDERYSPGKTSAVSTGDPGKITTRRPDRGTLEIFTDLAPSEVAAAQEAFLLTGRDAGKREVHRAVLRVEEAATVDAGTVRLEFAGLPVGASYSLSVVLRDGTRVSVFEGVPFNDLGSLSSRAAAPAGGQAAGAPHLLRIHEHWSGAQSADGHPLDHGGTLAALLRQADSERFGLGTGMKSVRPERWLTGLRAVHGLGGQVQRGGMRFEVKPPDYFRRREDADSRAKQVRLPKSQAQTHSALVGRARRYLAAPVQDCPASIEVTGRYEVEEQHEHHCVSVNQAGSHLEMWISTVRKPRRLHRLRGDLERGSPGSAAFSLRLSDTGAAAGSVRPGTAGGRPAVELELSLEGRTFKAVAARTSVVPVVSDAVLAALREAHPLAARHERFPLHVTHRQWLFDMLGPGALPAFFERFAEAPAPLPGIGTHNRHKVLMDLDHHVGLTFSTDEGLDPDDLPLLRLSAEDLLARTSWRGKSYRRQLQIMLDRDAIETSNFPMAGRAQNLKEQLHLQGTAGETYVYALSLNTTTAGSEIKGPVSAGFAGGELSIARRRRRDGPADWEQKYPVTLVQVGAGVGASATPGAPDKAVAAGEASSAFAYEPADFAGHFTMSALLGVRLGPLDGGWKDLTIPEREGRPQLRFDLSSVGLGDSPSLAGGVDVLVLTFGWAMYLSEEPPAHAIDRQYRQPSQARSPVHFRLGDAVLTGEALELLRVACANELRAFMDDTSALEIRGHTDRVDTEDRNFELSCYRAFNVLQALIDILGGSFRIPATRVSIRWFGESAAEVAAVRAATPSEEARLHVRDGDQNPSYRRVDVLLNHDLIVTLDAE